MKATVLGGGFAGLSAALHLALEGYEVVLLERDSLLGGKAQGWQGVPTGPTVLTLPELVRTLYQKANFPMPPLHPVSPLTHYYFADGREFAPTLEINPTLEQLGPAEQMRYVDLLEEAKQLYHGAVDTFLLAPPPTLLNLAQYGLKHGLKAHPFSSLEKLVQSGKYLTPFFLRFATYMGANPYHAPAVLHNIAHVELGLGVWHLQGGFARLVADLRAMLERLGVEIRLNTEVLALEQTNGKISGVKTNTGLERADLYISALDRAFTLELLGRAAPTYPLGVSGFAVLLKLEGDHGLAHKIQFPQDYALEWANISSGTLPRDPTLYLHTDGNTGFLMVNSPPVPAPDKAGYAALLLERLKAWQNLPILEHKILAPQDYARFGARGALYGRAPHGLLGTLRHPWQFAGVGNLWQVGGTVHPGGGVPLSLLSGWNGAGRAMGLGYERLGL